MSDDPFEDERNEDGLFECDTCSIEMENFVEYVNHECDDCGKDIDPDKGAWLAL
jgi:predicted RNA-binding Zn-ribbon protein involved in translation (DUF1610 family)